MKLLKENKALHANEFSNASPYVIMFGPDKCGNTNKVHFIFNHKHPKTGEYEEKHFDDSITAITEKGPTTLYTLHVKPDQTFEILVNGKSEHKGSLLEDFTPSVEPPKEIDDPDDKKPEDWVEEAQIPDRMLFLNLTPANLPLTQRQPMPKSQRIGMKMRRSRLLMRRPPSLRTGWTTSQTWSLTVSLMRATSLLTAANTDVC